MEDKRGEEHIKLSTEYGGKTQLNLGHNVDAARAKRGEGFELRTDEWGALRAGKGIFISADAQPAASGKQLEMDDAVAQLEQALTLARTLAGVAQIATATPGDIVRQKELDASDLEGAVNSNWDANAECLKNEYNVSEEKLEEVRAKLHELNRKTGLY